MPEPTAQRLLQAAFDQDAVLRGYIRAATRGSSEADDLSQRVWVVVCRKIASFEEGRSLRAWMLGIARLEVLKWRREQGRLPGLLSEESLERLGETAATEGDPIDLRLQHLESCIGELAPSARRVLGWRYVERQSHAQIGRLLGRSEAAAEMLLVRIRKLLRTCIERRTTPAVVEREVFP